MLGFAHRGGMADAPENSLEAFRNALAAGVAGLESDVWRAADGTAVLHHGPPHRERKAPVSMAELFAACGTDFDLSLDLKGPGTAELAITAARDAGFPADRLWLCAGRGTCTRLRQEHPQVRLVTDLRWREALLYLQPTLELIAAAGIDAVNLRHGRWTGRMVRRAHAAGLLAFGWDVNSRWALRWAARRGVDAIYSDHVSLLAEARRLS